MSLIDTNNIANLMHDPFLDLPSKNTVSPDEMSLKLSRVPAFSPLFVKRADISNAGARRQTGQTEFQGLDVQQVTPRLNTATYQIIKNPHPGCS